MARTKIKRRSYNTASPAENNSSREAESTLVEETVQDLSMNSTNIGDGGPDPVCRNVEAPKSPERENSPTLECDPEEENLRTGNVTPINRHVYDENISDVSTSSVDLNEDFAVPGCSRDNDFAAHAGTSFADRDHTYNMSPNSPLNLAWNLSMPGCSRDTEYVNRSLTNTSFADTHTSMRTPSPPLNLACDSMKENCQLQANSPDFRPRTPNINHIPVDQIFSPTTQRQIQSSIRTLFPNGPPPVPPVRPLKRPKKGDTPYIVGCTKRPRVSSPQNLQVFRGDNYGIPEDANNNEDEDYIPLKRSRRAANGTANLSRSRFNNSSEEIASKLQWQEKIDRLLGRAPKEEPLSFVKQSTSRAQAFSPLPSTSTDSETIMKNDICFSESLKNDFQIEDIDDEELPEIYWDTNKNKEDNNQNLPQTNNNVQENPDSNIIGEDDDNNNNQNNNNDNVVETEFQEIEFDKYMPKEQQIEHTEEEVNAEPKEPEVVNTIDLKNDDTSLPSTGGMPVTADVITIEDDLNVASNATEVTTSNNITNVLNPIITIVDLNSPVLKASNKIEPATETEATQPDLVIEVPETSASVNISQPSTSRENSWSQDVQFVSETRPSDIELPDYVDNEENILDVQIISHTCISQVDTRQLYGQIQTELKQFFSMISDVCGTKKWTTNKRTRPKKKQREQPNAASVNNENTAPNSRVTTPETSTSNSPVPTNGRKLGDCPICLDSLSTNFIASTNCGHVFCLECIKKSLKASGKKCPTCRTQLKGTGYHQVFL